jgi:flavin-dependent dehydrogenase
MSEDLKSANKNDIIIIGSGPTGLLSATLSLKLTPKRKIYLVENRPDATRTIMMWIDHEFLKYIDSSILDKINKQDAMCISNKITPIPCENTLDKYISNINEETRVQLNLLEIEWRKWLITQGIEFIVIDKNKPLTKEDFKDIKCENILMADGVSSTTSRNFFQIKHKLLISYAIVITFTCNLKENNYTQSDYNNLLLNQNSVVTYFSKPIIDNKSNGYIGLQVSYETYEKLKKYKGHELINNLKKEKEGIIYSNIEYKLYENIEPEYTGIFPINIQTATHFYTKIDNKNFFILGDAAYSTHFFSGLGMNRGMAAALKLYELMDSNNENIGELYNIFQKNNRNTLWKDIIPQYLYPISETLDKCKEDIDCIYNESIKDNDIRTAYNKKMYELTTNLLYSDEENIELKFVKYQQKYLKYIFFKKYLFYKQKYLKLKLMSKR